MVQVLLNDPTNLVWINADVEVVSADGESSQVLPFRTIKDSKFAFRHSHTSENPWVSCMTFRDPMTVKPGSKINLSTYEIGLSLPSPVQKHSINTTVEAPRRLEMKYS